MLNIPDAVDQLEQALVLVRLRVGVVVGAAVDDVEDGAYDDGHDGNPRPHVVGEGVQEHSGTGHLLWLLVNEPVRAVVHRQAEVDILRPLFIDGKSSCPQHYLLVLHLYVE